MEHGTLVEKIGAAYDHFILSGERSLFDKIGFLNIGYWKGVEDSIELAQINLIETLVSFFSNRYGNILDVACGNGASSKFLTKYFCPKDITGINISQRQLQICKLIAPECNFKLMDATQLDFCNASFDNVLCIEAALHFKTRRKFFEETYRVLRPAGRVSMLDFLCNYDLLDDIGIEPALLPKENHLPNLDAYRESLLEVGFKYVRVEDCTEFSVNAADSYVIRTEEMEFGRRQDCVALERIRIATLHRRAFSPGCLVYAIK
jgi:MPBQ/MSBQ methyltransferase